ncbi:conserved hypothetical protein [delta proteobacterium NaphS2]|nr:conserved hypothetical protein [delta proteobacterium NaphS2]EFK05780.1 conserved hypothetical protein [delta proteobacterium NaphS2]EFK06132.1 conserved hypothetical protein [delta proteobacterium NaphS2]EFK08341.1 conserved hypothetical protein [delta proteobacterium NaphS2]EFK09044.1 conserved hypothetical protein [delta proteobacterium NaphS2]
MVRKHPICPQRIRKIPKQFSWVDHRLVREHHIEKLSHPAGALYLFLVTVSDAQGLSYYSDPAISERLSMAPSTLEQSREELIRAGLVAHKKPLYQVLALDHHPQKRSGDPQSLGRILKQMMEVSHDRL